MDVTEGAGPALTAAPFPGQANVAALRQPGTEAGGERAAVGTGSDRLAMHHMLPPAADAPPAKAAAPAAPADQVVRKKRKNQGALDMSGTASCCLLHSFS